MGVVAGYDIPEEEKETEGRDFWDEYLAEEKFEKRREERDSQ